MQTISTTNPSNSNLSSALRSLRSAAQNWDRAEQSSTQVDRFVRSAEQEFRSADYPARRASYDNANTDSSFEGRQLDRHFRSGDRHLKDSQSGLREAGSGLRRAGADIDQGQVSLADLEREYRQANDPRLASVQRALNEVNSSESSFSRVGREWDQASYTLQFTESAVSRNHFDIQEISFDRPGKDVSLYGYRVASALQTIQSDLRQVDSNTRRATTDGNQGEGHLDQAIAILEGLEVR